MYKKNICLIDADSVIPNLALMKISTLYKKMGSKVTLIRVNLPYYPNRKKKVFFAPKNYDKIYCSVIYKGNKNFIKGDNIIFGGSGYDLNICLPDGIDKFIPDYNIYPQNDTSYGFISRGCIRKCSFCIVPQKEGHIRQVSNINDIVKHKKVNFLDNNFLALPNHKELLMELIDKNIRCSFNQGLDIKLIDNENSILLSKLNYLGEYIFAFDNWSYLKIIENKIKLLNWRKPYQLKFFVYCCSSMNINNIINRIEWLKTNYCLPYIMRDINCWKSKLSSFYIDLASYCNQPNVFKKMEFSVFLKKRYKKDKKRVRINTKLYYGRV